jgi:uncharacterized membrane-anchored protein YitT (DUF2179 family)
MSTNAFSTLSIPKELANLASMVAGSLLIALGVVLFLAPNEIATGGTPGLAILLNHLLPSFSLGSLMLLINIPLLLIGIRYIGKSFGIRTIIAILLVSAFVDLLKLILHFEPVSQDLLLATLFGGIAVGIGVGLVLRGNSSAGGSTILARVLAAKYNIKPGHTILALDALIIIASALVFNGLEQSLWSLISIYVTARCIDMVLTGVPSEKVVHIVTSEVETVAQDIIEHLGPYGTILSGTGLQQNQEKTMIFVVMESSRINTLRDIIHRNDPDAFMVVMNAAEMLGRGH